MDEIWIGCFAFFGGILRYEITELFPNLAFPVATLLINVVGSFALAWLTSSVGHVKHLSPQLALAMGTGMVGAFTTFSTLTLDTLKLITQRHFIIAALYIGLSIILGGLASWAGIMASRSVRSEVLHRD